MRRLIEWAYRMWRTAWQRQAGEFYGDQLTADPEGREERL